MFLRLLFFILISPLLFSESFAENCSDIANYGCFEDRVKQICDTSADWKGSIVGKVYINYPEYNAPSVAKTFQNILSQEKNPDQKNQLESDFSGTIQTSSRSPMIEFTRKLYQRNMNTIFACAISADRSDQLAQIQNLIGKESASSEIRSKLEKEQKYYKDIASGINNCDTNNQSAAPGDSMSWRLARSVT